MGSRGDLEGAAAALLAVLGGTAILAGSAAANNRSKSKEREALKEELERVKYQIQEYRSKFLGGFLYSSEIEELEEKKAKIEQKLNELQ